MAGNRKKLGGASKKEDQDWGNSETVIVRICALGIDHLRGSP